MDAMGWISRSDDENATTQELSHGLRNIQGKRRKVIWWTTILLLVVAWALPVAAQSNEEILKRLDAIEKRLNKLESAPNLGALIDPSTQNARQQKLDDESGKADMDGPSQPMFEASLLEAKFDGKDILGKQLVRIVAAVTNKTDRDATLINAHIVFSDKLGNVLGRITWSKSRGIGAGKTQKMSGSYSGSLGEDGLERIVEMDRSLLEVRFEVFKIAYKDGEVVKVKDCLMCDF